MSDHVIRRGVEADARMVGEVSFRSEKDEDLAYHVEWWTYYLGDEARSGGYQMFVAELNGAVVGFAMVGPLDEYDYINEARSLGAEKEVAVLHSIHVDPAWIGHGIGKGLLSASVGHLKTAGYRIAVLDTDASRERARRFYESGGWTLVETVASVAVYQLRLD